MNWDEDKNPAFPKAKRWKSKKYLRFVASLDCCVPDCSTDRDTVIPHHTEGGGRRDRDDLTIPACHFHHGVYHSITVTREEFEQAYNISIDEVIEETRAAWLAAGNKWED